MKSDRRAAGARGIGARGARKAAAVGSSDGRVRGRVRGGRGASAVPELVLGRVAPVVRFPVSMEESLFSAAPRLPWCELCGRRTTSGRMDHDVCNARLVMRVACHGERRIIYIDSRSLLLLGLPGERLPPEVYNPFPLPRLAGMLEAPKPPRKRGRALPETAGDRLTVFLMPPSAADETGPSAAGRG